MIQARENGAGVGVGEGQRGRGGGIWALKDEQGHPGRRGRQLPEASLVFHYQHREAGQAGAWGPGSWVPCRLLPEVHEKGVVTETKVSPDAGSLLPAGALRTATWERPGSHLERGAHALHTRRRKSDGRTRGRGKARKPTQLAHTTTQRLATAGSPGLNGQMDKRRQRCHEEAQGQSRPVGAGDSGSWDG